MTATGPVPAPHVGFLVVGSPRSGTTLVQRLACEIPGVAMPPETHFFSEFAGPLLTRRSFPLDGAALDEELERYLALPSSQGLALDAGAVVEDLGGRCDRPLALFEALVRHLSGPGEIYGEKTPGHLLWWRPIQRAAPHMHFVAVVRDPRAVVASQLTMPWEQNTELRPWRTRAHLGVATLWALLAQQVRALAGAVGPERCLVLRYEDVVADPDAARAGIASFLGRPAPTRLQEVPSSIVLPWETWKHGALASVSSDRVAGWRSDLDTDRARQVSVVCRSEMRRLGYGDDLPGPVAQAWGRIALGPGEALRQRRLRRTYGGYLEAIDRRRL